MPRPLRGMFRRGSAWYVRVYSQGRDRWKSLGSDYEEACRRYRQIKRGEAPVVRVTVADGAERWLETYVKTARNEVSQKTAKSRVRLHLVPFLGSMLMGNVGPDDLRRFRLWLERKDLSLQTVAHILSDARCLFRWAEDSGLIERAPVPRRLLPRIQERPPDRLNDDEVANLVALTGTLGFAIRFGLATGLRWGEMCRALTSDIENGILIVRRSKTGKIRRVPLPDDLLVELRGRVGKLIVWRETSKGSFNRDVRKASGVSRFHSHQLRHTFACRWLESGGSFPALQQILGHASIVTTKVRPPLRRGRLRRGEAGADRSKLRS